MTANTIRALVGRVGMVGTLPTDEADDRLRKQALTLTAAIILFIAPVYVAIYLALGRPLSAAIPGIYWVVSIIGLVHLARSKRYRFFRATQVSLMLTLPFVLQWSLGGFVQSSAVMVWAFVAPMGALVWYGPREAVGWFIVYLGLAVFSGLIDPWLAARATPLPEDLRLLFFVMTICGVSLVTYVVLHYFVRARERALVALDAAHQALQAEQRKSEAVLLNVMPAAIADRLKEGETVIADDHPDVTVVFADIVGFTPLAARLPAEAVVGLLDRVFSALDALAARSGLEKIKTVGDAYMAVAGAPVPRPDHAEAAAEMALAMQEAVDRSRTADDPPTRCASRRAVGPEGRPRASSAGRDSRTTCGATRSISRAGWRPTVCPAGSR